MPQPDQLHINLGLSETRPYQAAHDDSNSLKDREAEGWDTADQLVDVVGKDQKLALDSASDSEQNNVCLSALDVVQLLSVDPHFHNTYFEVRPSQGAGLGAFATRDLKKGDVILKEMPLFVSDSDSSLYREFTNLDPQTRDVASNLHANDQFKPGTNLIQGIWSTNWWESPSYVFHVSDRNLQKSWLTLGLASQQVLPKLDYLPLLLGSIIGAKGHRTSAMSSIDRGPVWF